MAGSDAAVWRSIRGDYEGLPAVEWTLTWSSRPPVSNAIQLSRQWAWFYPDDESLRARASAIFLKAAKARGYNCQDEWLSCLIVACAPKSASGFDGSTSAATRSMSRMGKP
jgi:hypothetical protein